MSDIFDSIKVSEEIKGYIDHSYNVAKRITEILKRQGKSQKELAQLLNKKESEISKWLSGHHNFTIKSIAKIEAVLGESLIEILGHSSEYQIRVDHQSPARCEFLHGETYNFKSDKADSSIFEDGLAVA